MVECAHMNTIVPLLIPKWNGFFPFSPEHTNNNEQNIEVKRGGVEEKMKEELRYSFVLLTRSSSRIISAMPGLISQSSALAFGRSEAIAIGSIAAAAERNDGIHFELLMRQLFSNEINST